MRDHVHGLVLPVCCTAVPAIQHLCVLVHRDVVVYLTGGHGPGYRRVPTYGGAIGSQGCGIMYTAMQ